MLIRDLAATDLAALRSWFADEAALIQWGGPDLRFPFDAAQMGEMPAEGDPRPSRWLFAGIEDDILAAHAQVSLDWRHGVARLARVGLAPSMRGRGLAVPFLSEVMDRVFREPAFERLELNVYTFNTAAIRTYKRLGFVPEGVRRAAVKVGSARWDTAMFGLLRPELKSAA
ncbi:MAG: hypothetical protein JWP20_937 [Roseomonas sp.]|jgi:RimJ/RimL family protein N-acetyltransferase|nr:hypothetical protein [Roseomonas sp.]